MNLLDNKKGVNIVILELSKAFDLVIYRLLLAKVEVISDSPALHNGVATFIIHWQIMFHLLSKSPVVFHKVRYCDPFYSLSSLITSPHSY